MKRRTILKRLALVTGGIVLIPACKLETEKFGLEAFTNLNISKEDHEMMAQLCEIIIPAGNNTKGAMDLGLESFVLLMANDCLTRQQQEDFLKGWQNFKNYSSNNGVNPFRGANNKILEEMVLAFYLQEEKGGKQASIELEMEGTGYFFKTIKQFSILGYTYSEYYMTTIMSYKMATGKFKGIIPLNEQKKVNLYG